MKKKHSFIQTIKTKSETCLLRFTKASNGLAECALRTCTTSRQTTNEIILNVYHIMLKRCQFHRISFTFFLCVCVCVCVAALFRSFSFKDYGQSFIVKLISMWRWFHYFFFRFPSLFKMDVILLLQLNVVALLFFFFSLPLICLVDERFYAVKTEQRSM